MTSSSIPKASWTEYCDGLWQLFRHQRFSGLCAFEQMALRSCKEKRCHRCGERAELVWQPVTPWSLIKCTGYYLCSGCLVDFAEVTQGGQT